VQLLTFSIYQTNRINNPKKPNSPELLHLKGNLWLTAGIPILIGIDGNAGNGVAPKIGKEMRNGNMKMP
jgi:hypothetical protein